MLIHIVQPGETLNSIADFYRVSVTRLMHDNGLSNPIHIVHGQALVIVYPRQTYIVQEGDTLTKIADIFEVSVMQLLRNNPFLWDREYIYPGETLVIHYDTKDKICVNGYSNAFVNSNILKKTLPYLTYLTINNYRATIGGDIVPYYDETEIIKISKEYGVAPLLLVSTLTEHGKEDIEMAYQILLCEKCQNSQLEKLLNVLKTKGYYGVNIVFQYVNPITQILYEKLLDKATSRLNEEGFQIFVTINPNIKEINNEVMFDHIDYKCIGELTNKCTFMKFVWATKKGLPSPVTSNHNMNIFLDYVKEYFSSDKLNMGIALVGYDWNLSNLLEDPKANSLSLDGVMELARNVDASIQFDDKSKSPYFEYVVPGKNDPERHIVWFVDARSLDALLNLHSKYGFCGVGFWNIMSYNTQLCTIINSQYEIEKV